MWDIQASPEDVDLYNLKPPQDSLDSHLIGGLWGCQYSSHWKVPTNFNHSWNCYISYRSSGWNIRYWKGNNRECDKNVRAIKEREREVGENAISQEGIEL